MARELLAVPLLATIACGVTQPIQTPPASSPTAACYACGTAPGTCTGANCVLNVRDYGAAGDGKTDDTQAIQCAIDAASNPKLFPSGAGVYLPPGRYAISIARSAAKGLSALAIGASNIRLFGDGDSSVLYVPSWEQKSTNNLDEVASYVFIGNGSRDVNNVVLERFAFVGNLDPTSESPDTAADAVQIGSGQQTFAVDFSGLRDMSFRGTARALGLYGGPVPQEAPVPALRAVGDFAVESRFTNLAGQAVGCHSGEYVDTLIRGNAFKSVRGLALDIWSGATLITGNTFDDVIGGGMAFNQPIDSIGWTVVSDNTIATVGKGLPESPAAIQLGENAPAYRILISNNAIQDAYGSGILSFQACEANFEGNVVDGFGLGGEPSVGIQADNIYCSSRIVGNEVHCTSSDAGCTYGIILGGSVDQNAWSDGNTVIGVTNVGGTAFVQDTTAGLDLSTTSNVYLGRNVDIDTGLDAPISQLPIHQVVGNDTFSVAGAKVWQVYNQTGGPAALAGLTGCSLGNSVTLFFNGLDDTTLQDDGPGGPFDLAGNFTAPGKRNSVLNLLCVSPDPVLWVEVSRSND